MVQLAKEFGLHEPDYTYKDNAGFVSATNKCIDYPNWTTASDQRIPRDILVAMAVVESKLMEQVDLQQKAMHYLV